MRATLKKAAKNYITSQKQKIIQQAVIGPLILVLLETVVHISALVKEHNVAGAIILVLIVLLPIIVDFVFFLTKNSNPLNERLYELNEAVFKLNNKKNMFKLKLAGVRLEREEKHLAAISNNNFTLLALQNFEYIREVMQTILLSIMSNGDRYITVSNLNFWVEKPRKPMEFLKKNLEALKDRFITIDRVIVLDQRLKDKNETSEDVTENRVLLADLLKEFLEKIDLKTNGENKTSAFKTLFYFDEKYEMNKKYLLSALIIAKDLKSIMFVKILDWDEKDLKNPRIEVKYYSTPKFSTKISGLDIADTYIILKELCDYIGEERKNLESSEDYREVFEYLTLYTEYFFHLHSIYDASGNPNTAIDLNEINFYNLSMIKQHFEQNLNLKLG